MKLDRDSLMGRLAVEKGLISGEQLKECVREQQRIPRDPNRTIGRGEKMRPIVQVMLEKGLITERQLTTLLEEQAKRISVIQDFKRSRKEDFLFGQLLVRNHKSTQIQINKCLEIQQKMLESGAEKIPRLGEILVEHGYVTADTIREILKKQDKVVLICTNCMRRYNVVGVRGDRAYRCKLCGGIMVTQDQFDHIGVDETAFGHEVVQEEIPGKPDPEEKREKEGPGQE